MAAQNGNGKTTQVSISTLIQKKYQGGDLYQAISQLLERRPTGKLLINVSQGGINSMEWTSVQGSDVPTDDMKEKT